MADLLEEVFSSSSLGNEGILSLEEERINMRSELQLLPNLRLFEISNNKKFLSYVTEDFQLYIHELVNLNDSVVTVGSNAFAVIPESSVCCDMSKDFRWETKYESGTFLSVSCDGENAIISFLFRENYLRFIEFEDNKRNRRENIGDDDYWYAERPHCFIYKRKGGKLIIHNGGNEVRNLGCAVFLDDRQIFMDSGYEANFFCASTFKLSHIYFRNGGGPRLLPRKSTCGSAFSKYASFKSGTNTSDMSLVYVDFLKHCISATTVLAKQNIAVISRKVLVEEYYTREEPEVAQLWSLSNGSLMEFLLQDTESIMAVSENHQFLVTMTMKNQSINIYDIKSTMVVSVLSHSGYNNGWSSGLDGCQAQFCFNNKNILVTCLQKSIDDGGAEKVETVYSLWNIADERLMIYESVPSTLSNGFIFSPLVIENVDDISKLPKSLTVFDRICYDNRGNDDKAAYGLIKGFSLPLCGEEEGCDKLGGN